MPITDTIPETCPRCNASRLGIDEKVAYYKCGTSISLSSDPHTVRPGKQCGWIS